MKITLKSIATCAALGLCLSAQAASFTVDPSYSWQGYMNVFALPPSGGGLTSGAYMFGSSWGTPDLVTSWNGGVLTLAPNTINDPAAYWYTPAGGPGAKGNKIMDASFYVEPAAGTLAGQTVTFSGNVLANTLFGKTDLNGLSWTSVAFIKDFAPDYSSSVTTTIPLTPGDFSITMNTINDPARHVQYGFETIGPDVWATDVAQYGNIQVTAVPEPSTLALIGLAFAVPALLRRRS